MTMPKSFSCARLVAACAVGTLLVPAAASAQIRQVSSSSSEPRQVINFTLGGFVPRSLDSRVTGDVLFADLQSDQPLLFQVKDFDTVTIGGEYLLRVAPRVEAGVGVGFSQRTVPSVYANVTHSDSSDITQDLKLRMVPVSFTGRFLLLPSDSPVQAYVGGGIVAIRWRYSETGDFVADDNSIFSGNFVAQGTAVGPTILAGVRAPVGSVLVGGEIRWQKATGTGLLAQNVDFLDDKIDLGGLTGNFTIGFKF